MRGAKFPLADNAEQVGGYARVNTKDNCNKLKIQLAFWGEPTAREQTV